MSTNRQQRTGIRRMVSRGWVVSRQGRGLVIALLVGLLGLWHTGYTADFSCAAGDVACLIDAINQANANGEVNTITLEAGTYTLTAADNNTDGPNGLPSVTSTLTIQGAGADTTILERGTNVPLFRFLHVAATGTLTLERLTLTGGGGLALGFQGGGLFNHGGTVAIAQTVFADNVGDPGGGLINNGGTLTIAETTFVNNGSGHGGGGLRNFWGTVTITHTTFTRNTADGGGGLLQQGGTVTITDSTFVDNNGGAQGGGGLFNVDGSLTMTKSTLAHNRASGLVAAGAGSGFSCTGTTLVLNSTIAENIVGAGARGGGINAIRGTVILLNTILARNMPGSSPAAPDCIGSVTSLGHNLIGDPTGCTLTLQPTDLTGDPGLGDFTDDGTPGNGHFPLLSGSPAIDAGNNAFCPPTDQLGEPRVGPCDIGAIEFQGKHHK